MDNKKHRSSMAIPTETQDSVVSSMAHIDKSKCNENLPQDEFMILDVRDIIINIIKTDK